MLLLLAAAACGNRASTTGPRITALDGQASVDRPAGSISIRGNVIDSRTGQPIPLAHISYDRQVARSNASGSFSFSSVPAGQTISVVAPGYRRAVRTWNPAQFQIKLDPFEAHGLYMPFTGLTDPAIAGTIDRLTSNTEINTVVVEVKTDNGQVSSQMATPAAQQAHAAVDGVDVRAFVQKLHDRGLYVVGRFVVYRDPILVRAHPEYALVRLDNGQTYQDEEGERWIDAFREEVWQYNLDLAERTAQLGIDEIQFDYVRFPGTPLPIEYAEPMTEENRVAVIAGFLKRAEERLRPYGIAIAADTFGLTTVANDDTGIGQEIESLGRFIDYYCPMVYPSTWADGSLGVAYPPADPYTIVHNSVRSAVRRLANIPTVRVRPWLQAFDDYRLRRLDYTPDMVQIQKTAGIEAGGLGWMLWHPTAQYDPRSIAPAAAGQASTAAGH